MRQVGTVDNETQVRRFADYLLTLGIQTTVEPDRDGAWVIWAHDEDRVADARREFELFRNEPDAPRYREAEEQAARARREEERRAERARRNVVDMRARWQRPALVQTPITFFLIAFSVLVAFNTRFEGPSRSPLAEWLMIAPPAEVGGIRIPARWPNFDAVLQGQVWRLITPIFLHFSLLHILFNVLMTHAFGTIIESLRGSGRFLLMVLVIGIVSNVAQYAFAGPYFGGLSGVVYGLFGYLWMKSRYEPESGMFVPPNTVFWLLGWLVVSSLLPGLKVANTAHAVGLAVGMLWGYARTLRGQLMGR